MYANLQFPKQKMKDQNSGSSFYRVILVHREDIDERYLQDHVHLLWNQQFKVASNFWYNDDEQGFNEIKDYLGN